MSGVPYSLQNTHLVLINLWHKFQAEIGLPSIKQGNESTIYGWFSHETLMIRCHCGFSIAMFRSRRHGNVWHPTLSQTSWQKCWRISRHSDSFSSISEPLLHNLMLCSCWSNFRLATFFRHIHPDIHPKKMCGISPCKWDTMGNLRMQIWWSQATWTIYIYTTKNTG